MRKNYICFIFCLLIIKLHSQQTTQYTQFIFNKIGYNPASSGLSLNSKYELIFGARSQWLGFSNNPTSGFISYNYNFIPQHGYTKWHNIGMYIDHDQAGDLSQDNLWLSYAFHLLVSKKTIMSFGVFGGIKHFNLSTSNLDKSDPAIAKSSSSVWAYPNIVPGIRVTNKKMFIDLCFQNVTINRKSGFGGQIGSPSKLFPHYTLNTGYKFKINDLDNLVAAVNLHSSLFSLPSVEINIINYYNKRFALGASLRSKNFISAILQFRLQHNLSVGFAYDLSINKTRQIAPSTAEIMISLSPLFGGEIVDRKAKLNVTECTF